MWFAVCIDCEFASRTECHLLPALSWERCTLRCDMRVFLVWPFLNQRDRSPANEGRFDLRKKSAMEVSRLWLFVIACVLW
jgi:hypothetical protein